MLEQYTEGYFRLGSLGYGRIERLEIITLLNLFLGRYVTFQVRYWPTDAFEGEGQLLTVEGVQQWTVKVDTSVVSFDSIRDRMIDLTLTAVIGKNPLPDQARLKWRLERQNDRPIKRQLLLAENVYASVVLSQMGHREMWEAQGLNQPYRQLCAQVEYQLEVKEIYRQGKSQLPPKLSQTDFTLARGFRSTERLRSQVLQHATSQLQQALKLPAV